MASTASGLSQVAADHDRRSDMVERIFRHFDADGDGGLDSQEMAGLVVALNPRIRFTEEQIGDVVGRVFQFYSKAARITLGALLCIYDDVAGDVHSDFDALFLSHLPRHTSSASPPENGFEWDTTNHEEEGWEKEEEGDVVHLSPTDDSLPSADPSLASSSFRSEDDSSQFDYDGYEPSLDAAPSFRWILSRSRAPQRGAAGYAPEGNVADHLATLTVLDRLPSTDSSLASSLLPSEDESLESDYGGRPPPLGTEEMPSLRWMLPPAVSPQRKLASNAPSLASSSLTSEAEISEPDRGGYAPQAELEEIPSPTFRWSPSPAFAPQTGGWYAQTPPEEVGDHERGRGTSSSWARIRKLGTFYRLRNLRHRKN